MIFRTVFKNPAARWVLGLLLAAALAAGVRFSARLQATPPPALPDLETVRAIFPRALSVQPGPKPDILSVLDAQSQTLGALILTSPAADSIRGYGGPVPLIIGLTLQGRIAGVEFLPNWESGDYVEKIRDSGLLSRWTGLAWNQVPALKVDTITGATLTSGAVISSLRRRLSMEGKAPALTVPQKSWQPWLSLLLILVSLAVCLLRFPGRPRARTLVLLASIGYLGFFSGTFLSVDLFGHWLMQGWDWRGQWIWLILAGTALLAGWIWRRAWYCQYLCPFGALQELIHRFSPRALTLPSALQKILVWFRRSLLLAAALILGLQATRDLTRFEPFTAFNLGVASDWVLILASVFLVLSLFFPRPWCRFACPTGELLELLRRKK